MAKGELAAALEALARDAAQTGRSIARKAATAARDAAHRAEASATTHLENDARAADRITAAHPGIPPAGQDLAGQPKQLLPARNTMSLAQLRGIRDRATRARAGEDFTRTKYGGEPETHYPVALNSDPDFPVTRPGGRKVDVPVKLSNGTTLAVEVKTYQNWRTVTLADGSNTPQKVEVPLSADIRQQINKDVALRAGDPNYDPRWEFLGAGPSDALSDYLTKAGIIFIEHH
jgi:hypothetical protein